MRRCFTFVFAVALIGCARGGVQSVARTERGAAERAASPGANVEHPVERRDERRAGALDESFGAGGTVVTSFAPTVSEGEAHAVALQSGGRIVAAGRFGGLAGLARYTRDGALDETFGARGVATLTLAARGVSSSLIISSLFVQPDDKIVACAVGRGGRVLARYTGDGKPDASFGRGGTVVEREAASDAAIALQRDGKIVWAHGGGGRSQFALARYLPTGARDAGFGKKGIATARVGAAESTINAIVLQPDGKIVAAGTTYESLAASTSSVASPSKQHVALARFTADGRPDPSFGRAGVVSDESDAALGTVEAIALQADGKIVVAGSGGFADAVRRYLPDGTFETTLGGSASVSVPERGASLEGFNALAVQPDGKVVAAGAARAGSVYYFAVARYQPDGQFDREFGAGGATLTKAEGGEGALALALQPDGKIVLAGTGRHQFMLARYLP